MDVADSYASIAESARPIADEMLPQCAAQLCAQPGAEQPAGMAIYNILHKLFLSADSTSGIDPDQRTRYSAGVRSALPVAGQRQRADHHAGIFLWRKSDIEIFRGFVSMFSNKNWKVTGNAQWVCITSLKGKPVSIYANRALPQETGEG